MSFKEIIYKWFKETEPHHRLQLVCGLLNMCLPIERRFIRTYVEFLVKGDESFQDLHKKANDSSEVDKLDLNHKTSSKFLTYIALMDAENRNCSKILFETISKTSETVYDTALFNNISSTNFLREVLLIFTMVLYHPAFRLEQKSHVTNQLRTMQKNVKLNSHDNYQDLEPYQNLNHQSFEAWDSGFSMGTDPDVLSDHICVPVDNLLQNSGTSNDNFEAVTFNGDLMSYEPAFIFQNEDFHCELQDENDTDCVDGVHNSYEPELNQVTNPSIEKENETDTVSETKDHVEGVSLNGFLKHDDQENNYPSNFSTSSSLECSVPAFSQIASVNACLVMSTSSSPESAPIYTTVSSKCTQPTVSYASSPIVTSSTDEMPKFSTITIINSQFLENKGFYSGNSSSLIENECGNISEKNSIVDHVNVIQEPVLTTSSKSIKTDELKNKTLTKSYNRNLCSYATGGKESQNKLAQKNKDTKSQKPHRSHKLKGNKRNERDTNQSLENCNSSACSSNSSFNGDLSANSVLNHSKSNFENKFAEMSMQPSFANKKYLVPNESFTSANYMTQNIYSKPEDNLIVVPSSQCTNHISNSGQCQAPASKQPVPKVFEHNPQPFKNCEFLNVADIKSNYDNLVANSKKLSTENQTSEFFVPVPSNIVRENIAVHEQNVATHEPNSNVHLRSSSQESESLLGSLPTNIRNVVFPKNMQVSFLENESSLLSNDLEEITPNSESNKLPLSIYPDAIPNNVLPVNNISPVTSKYDLISPAEVLPVCFCSLPVNYINPVSPNLENGPVVSHTFTTNEADAKENSGFEVTPKVSNLSKNIVPEIEKVKVENEPVLQARVPATSEEVLVIDDEPMPERIDCTTTKTNNSRNSASTARRNTPPNNPFPPFPHQQNYNKYHPRPPPYVFPPQGPYFKQRPQGANMTPPHNFNNKYRNKYSGRSSGNSSGSSGGYGGSSGGYGGSSGGYGGNQAGYANRTRNVQNKCRSSDSSASSSQYSSSPPPQTPSPDQPPPEAFNQQRNAGFPNGKPHENYRFDEYPPMGHPGFAYIVNQFPRDNSMPQHMGGPFFISHPNSPRPRYIQYPGIGYVGYPPPQPAMYRYSMPPPTVLMNHHYRPPPPLNINNGNKSSREASPPNLNQSDAQNCISMPPPPASVSSSTNISQSSVNKCEQKAVNAPQFPEGPMLPPVAPPPPVVSQQVAFQNVHSNNSHSFPLTAVAPNPYLNPVSTFVSHPTSLASTNQLQSSVHDAATQIIPTSNANTVTYSSSGEMLPTAPTNASNLPPGVQFSNNNFNTPSGKNEGYRSSSTYDNKPMNAPVNQGMRNAYPRKNGNFFNTKNNKSGGDMKNRARDRNNHKHYKTRGSELPNTKIGVTKHEDRSYQTRRSDLQN